MEVWKDIKGYEGYYQVSNQGRVRSLDSIKKDKNGRAVKRKGKVLTPQPNSRGYLRVCIGTSVLFIHRLVALHFVDNHSPLTNTIVNHLDSNYLNNNADNLEWTTHYGNVHHAINRGRTKRTSEWLQHLRESHEKNGKGVVGTNIATGEEIRFVCLNDC